MRLSRWSLLPLLAILVLPLPARASDPLTSALSPNHWQLSASSGWLSFKPYGSSGATWQGVDLAPAATLSLHPSFSVGGRFAYGVPFAARDGRLAMADVSASLRLYPPVGAPPGPNRVDASAGPSWQGTASLKDWSGLATQLSAAHFFNAHAFAFGKYAHAFAWDPAKGDKDYFRLGLGIGTPLGW